MPNLVNTLDELFANRMFEIPDYQRGYAWEKQQWDDLIQDLELLPTGRNHFTGTLVLCPVDGGSAKVQDSRGWVYSCYDVIDGQQRLTTAILFLHAIHAEMNQIDALRAIAGGLWERYMAVQDGIGQPLTKLTLNHDCQDFYAQDVLGLAPGVGGPVIHSHELLAGARSHFASYLTEQHAVLGVDYAGWLRELYFKIAQHLILIVYEVDSTIDAGVIFETMNDRGKKLTEMELVKNHLLYIASKLDLPAEHNLGEQINMTWKHVFERLMAARLGTSDHEDRLLRAHWLMAYDPDRRHWQQSRSIKGRFNLRSYQGRHPQLLGDVQAYLHTLWDAATAYCDIHAPRHSMAFNDCAEPHLRQEIAHVSEKLARLGARAGFLPLLMAARLRAGDGGQIYLKAVELCEKFDFRVYQWLGYKSAAGQPWLFHLGYRFFHDRDAVRLLNELSAGILRYCPDERFRERFSRETENWYAWYGLKYFLYEYEQRLAQREREPVQVCWEEIWDVKRDTIEHVLPQTPTDAYWLDRFTEAQRQRWTNDIGNLTLTYDNSFLGNKPFPDKKGDPCRKNCYATAKLFVEQQLAHYAEWTEYQIRERREQIQQWAVERWQVKIPEAQLETDVPSLEEPGPRLETPEERLLRLARAKGTAEAFQAILDAARRHSGYLYPRMHKYWWVVKYTPLRNKAKTLFWLQVDPLLVEFVYENFERFLGIPAAEARQILGPEEKYVIEKTEVNAFIARLDQLIERVKEIQQGHL